MPADPEDAQLTDRWDRELRDRGRVELVVSDQKVVLALLAVLLLVGLCFWVATSVDEPWALIPASVLRVIGWLGVVTMLVNAVPLLVSLAMRGPAVVIDHAGVHTCHRPRLSLEWEEINGAAVWPMAGHGVLLTVAPARVREWQAGLDWQSWVLARMNRTRTTREQLLLPRLLDCPSEPLASWLSQEAEAHRPG